MLDGKIKKCKHLVKPRSPSTRHLCRIYGRRIGTLLDTDKQGREIRCIMRSDVPYDIPGCSLNTNKPWREY